MKTELKIGTRIYYTGDMANSSDFGTITRIIKDPIYDPHYVIKFDDGRETRITRASFSDKYLGHGGTRFVTEAAYNEYRQEKLNLLNAGVL